MKLFGFFRDSGLGHYGLPTFKCNGYDADEKDLKSIHKAAVIGDLNKVKSCVKKGKVNQADKRGRTALHFACAQGNVELLGILVACKAVYLDGMDENNQTPLMKAVQCQHLDCLRRLTASGANLNLCDTKGDTALHLAVTVSNVALAQVLMENGANVNAANKDGCTPLILATKLNDHKLVEFLLSNGADVNSREITFSYCHQRKFRNTMSSTPRPRGLRLQDGRRVPRMWKGPVTEWVELSGPGISNEEAVEVRSARPDPSAMFWGSLGRQSEQDGQRRGTMGGKEVSQGRERAGGCREETPMYSSGALVVRRAGMAAPVECCGGAGATVCSQESPGRREQDVRRWRHKPANGGPLKAVLGAGPRGGACRYFSF
ncbi:ANKR7 protein, partial [Polypterus senegalus]